MGPNTKASALSLFLVNSRKKIATRFLFSFSPSAGSHLAPPLPHTHTLSLSLCSIKSSAALAPLFPQRSSAFFLFIAAFLVPRSSESQTSSPSSPCAVYLLPALMPRCQRRYADKKKGACRVEKEEKDFSLCSN